MVSDHENTPAEKARWESLIRAQMTVLNDSYAGGRPANAANTPFRFTLSKVTWSVNRRGTTWCRASRASRSR